MGFLPGTLAAVLLLSMSAASAQNTTNTTALPALNAAAGTDAASPANNSTTASLVSVEQAVPAFTGIRSCLPFNILISPASNATSPTGRILVEADFAVLNSTAIAVEDGILSLSLTGGFETRLPINFTIIAPGASQLNSVVNQGSGLVVLGPGHKVNSIRLVAPSVGQILATNITAGSVTLQSSGVLRSSVSGALDRVEVSSSGTGNVGVVSSKPTQLVVDLSGITTVLANTPPGSRISGSAGGLSKVQYTAGTCQLGSDTIQLFSSSIFGGSRFGLSGGIGRKCQQVAAAALNPLTAALENPQWTCGIIVDGQHLCQGANATVIPWNISEEAVAAANTTAAAPATNAATALNVPVQPGAGNAAAPSNAAAANGTNTSNTAAAPGNAAAGTNAAPAAPNTPAANAAAAAANAAPPSPTVETIGLAAGNAAGNEGGTASVAVESLPRPTGGVRRRDLLQGLTSGPTIPLTVTPTPAGGTLGTGAVTSGPGTFASGTGSVTGPDGTTTQTTSSEGGQQPETRLTTGGVGSNLFNPLFIPATPPATPATNATTTTDTATATDTATPTTATPTNSISSASAGGSSPSVSTFRSGPGSSTGVAIASTTCASRSQSLSMIVQPMEGDAVGSGNNVANVTDVASGVTSSAENATAVNGGNSAVASAEGDNAVSSATATSSSSPEP